MDNNKQTAEVIDLETHSEPQHFLIKLFATTFSYVFHPLFIPIYVTLFLVYQHPYLFSAETDIEKLRLFLQMFVNCTFLPLVSVLLLRGLNFVDSIFLQSQKERIIPYIISMIFYFWNWYAFKNNIVAEELVSFSLALFIASIIGFMANIVLKISLHAIAVSVMSCFIAWLTFREIDLFILYMLISFLITGAVCTARQIVSNHSKQEIYLGIVVGLISQLLAIYFVVS